MRHARRLGAGRALRSGFEDTGPLRARPAIESRTRRVPRNGVRSRSNTRSSTRCREGLVCREARRRAAIAARAWPRAGQRPSRIVISPRGSAPDQHARLLGRGARQMPTLNPSPSRGPRRGASPLPSTPSFDTPSRGPRAMVSLSASQRPRTRAPGGFIAATVPLGLRSSRARAAPLEMTRRALAVSFALALPIASGAASPSEPPAKPSMSAVHRREGRRSGGHRRPRRHHRARASR